LGYHHAVTTTRQLELFIAVADAGSMRKAADRLGISQPSISKQIRALERSVGGPLIQRTRGGRAMLSPLGLEFLGDARSSLEMHRRFVQRIGAEIPPRIYLRSYLLEIIKNRFETFEAAGLPQDTSFIVSDDPLAVMSTSDSLQNSFAISGRVSLPAGKDFISHVILERTCSVYAAPAIAAALADGSLRPADVPNLYPSRKFTLTPWLRAMMRHTGLASRNEVYGLQFVELIAQQVANGEGLSVFMDFHVQPLVEEGRLVALARCRDALLQVLMADPAVDSAMFTRVCRALHAL
jgi:DNA-binding transcriptional LysR family regulator